MNKITSAFKGLIAVPSTCIRNGVSQAARIKLLIGIVNGRLSWSPQHQQVHVHV